jgi:hypothetical protein
MTQESIVSSTFVVLDLRVFGATIRAEEEGRGGLPTGVLVISGVPGSFCENRAAFRIGIAYIGAPGAVDDEGEENEDREEFAMFYCTQLDTVLFWLLFCLVQISFFSPMGSYFIDVGLWSVELSFIIGGVFRWSFPAVDFPTWVWPILVFVVVGSLIYALRGTALGLVNVSVLFLLVVGWSGEMRRRVGEYYDIRLDSTTDRALRFVMVFLCALFVAVVFWMEANSIVSSVAGIPVVAFFELFVVVAALHMIFDGEAPCAFCSSVPDDGGSAAIDHYAPSGDGYDVESTTCREMYWADGVTAVWVVFFVVLIALRICVIVYMYESASDSKSAEKAETPEKGPLLSKKSHRGQATVRWSSRFSVKKSPRKNLELTSVSEDSET